MVNFETYIFCRMLKVHFDIADNADMFIILQMNISKYVDCAYIQILNVCITLLLEISSATAKEDMREMENYAPRFSVV